MLNIVIKERVQEKIPFEHVPVGSVFYVPSTKSLFLKVLDTINKSEKIGAVLLYNGVGCTAAENSCAIYRPADFCECIIVKDAQLNVTI